MSVQLVMSYVYPLLAVATFAMTILFALFFLSVRRVRLALANTVYWFWQSVSFVLLTLTTGASPMLDIEHFRVWIVLVRVVMLLNVLWVMFETVRLLYLRSTELDHDYYS